MNHFKIRKKGTNLYHRGGFGGLYDNEGQCWKSLEGVLSHINKTISPPARKQLLQEAEVVYVEENVTVVPLELST